VPAVSDIIFGKHEKDFEILRKSRKRSLAVQVVLALFVCASLYFSFEFIAGLKREGDSIRIVREELSAVNSPWSKRMLASYDSFRAWLTDHSTRTEARIFDSVSQIVMRAALSLEISRNEDPSFMQRASLSFYFALMRVSFMLVACFRFWLLAVVMVLLLNSTGLKAHAKSDILGETGNGRLFFSGAKVKLDARSVSGATDLQVTGLACPKKVSAQIARSSDLGHLLTKFGVANDTNITLLSVILASAQMPAYVASADEQNLLSSFFEGGELALNTYLILEKALSLHASYQDDAKFQLPELKVKGGAVNEKLSQYLFSSLVQQSLHRALTPAMRASLAELRPTQIASAILAYEAGKTLTYTFEAGKWLQRSNFSYLNARAVLHSIPAYAAEYDYNERADIRRALIYAARSSEFGPVRLPLDLSDRSAALRQWIEVLSALPHELQSVTDEVELFALVRESESLWNERFFASAATLQPETSEDVFASMGTLFFMPLVKVLKLCRGVIDPARIRRIEELCFLVSQKQKLHSMSMELKGDVEKHLPLAPDRIFPPLGLPELKVLAERHGLSVEDVKDWTALRVVFNTFGWLGRRVGDHSVPESSLIFAVFKPMQAFQLDKQQRLIGKPGMVAFRATRLEAKWGKGWPSRFIRTDSVVMAETREDYEKALAGIPEAPPPEDDVETGASSLSAG